MYKNFEWLNAQYTNNKKSLSIIARECNVNYNTILKWMIKFNIPRRSVSEANSDQYNPSYKGGIITDKQWLEIQCQAGLSIRDISKLAKTSIRTVCRYLKKFKLKTLKLRKPLRGKDNPRWSGKQICACGSRKTSSSKVCQKCYYKKRIGINSPTWKGVADIMSSIRTRVMPDWRQKIFQRDNYTCCKCLDNKGGNLEAHHIKTLSSIIKGIIKNNQHLNIKIELDRLKIIDIACKNEEILDIKNGITLCSSCHKDIHKGKRQSIINI